MITGRTLRGLWFTISIGTLLLFMAGACGADEAPVAGGQAPPEMSSTPVVVTAPTEVVGTQRNSSSATATGTVNPNAVVIGLDADMSSGSAESGEAIRRGILLALDEVNARGGVLGRPLQLIVKDHRGNPARGIDNIADLAGLDNLVAVIGGLHTPVALAELETIHANQIVYLDSWAAGTPVVENGYAPNYVFRVSVRDEYAGEYLIEQALDMGYRSPALLLEQTGWGRSNHLAMTAALDARGLAPSGIQWFNWGVPEDDMKETIRSLRGNGADVIMLVANAPEGAVVVRSMAALPGEQRRPIVSHWGITGGGFFEDTRDALPDVDLLFLQTFSFIDPPFPERTRSLVDAYCARFAGCQSARDIFAPVGTAHAYELVHMLALAIERAGTIDRTAVRDAMEQLGPYSGLIRDYDQPFTPDLHDALDASDFQIARYDSDGVVVPVEMIER